MFDLNLPVKSLPGVGPKMGQKLERLGIEKIRDLLFYFPRTYQDFSCPQLFARARIGEDIIVKAKIESIREGRTKNRWLSIIEAQLVDEAGNKMKAVWFNQGFLKTILESGDEWLFLGKISWDFKGKEKNILVSQMEKEAKILPVYGETEGLSSKFLRKILRPVLQDFKLPEFLPEKIIKEQKLIGLKEAIERVHFPGSSLELKQARERLAFDELFLIALRFLSIKKELQQNNAPAMTVLDDALKEFVNGLPFKLTDAQRKAAWEIIKNLQSHTPMNRLLEGDVGSGKTVVAAMAAYVAIKNKNQVVWLAPTEILANQHFLNIQKLFANFNFKVGLLTSASKKADLANDDLIIGTHALIQKNIQISNLGLIIIDEQHRFGVKQRGYLRQKNPQKKQTIPHLLSMTATPIPRTLALALYGDLDISIINQLPCGRQKIITKVVQEKNRQKAYQFIRSEIENGRQAFVICPLIETHTTKTETIFENDRKTAVEEFNKLSKKIYPDLKIGLMHGKLKSKEKDEVMSRFQKKEIDILVSTAVVEVGIDIPNATIMMIEDADRFGLAQLHQFRGRVGRGQYQSYCLLFTEADSAKTKERLEAMCNSTDGFRLAQIDLELRGPGELAGTEQSGILDLKMANLSDTISIEKARRAAEKVIDEGLKKFPNLCDKLKEFEVEKHLE